MNANHARRMSAPLNVSNKDQLFAADERRDCALCGCSLAEPGTTRFAKQGAHDPTPTPYWKTFFLNWIFLKNPTFLT